MLELIKMFKEAIDLTSEIDENHKKCCNFCNCSSLIEQRDRVIAEIETRFEVEVKACL